MLKLFINRVIEAENNLYRNYFPFIKLSSKYCSTKEAVFKVKKKILTITNIIVFYLNQPQQLKYNTNSFRWPEIKMKTFTNPFDQLVWHIFYEFSVHVRETWNPWHCLQLLCLSDYFVKNCRSWNQFVKLKHFRMQIYVKNM